MRVYPEIYIHKYIPTYAHTDRHADMMQGCHTPPPPPPCPMVSPLACEVGSCVVCAICFPLILPRPLPPVEWGLWSFWLAPPSLWGTVCSTEVWYGCCRLSGIMSSLRALSPPPPGVGPVVVLVGPTQPVWGSVFYRDMVLLPLVCSNVIVTCSLPCKI